MKRKYVSPTIDEYQLELEGSILAASHVNEPIEEDVEVVSMGQGVIQGEEWNFEWEI